LQLAAAYSSILNGGTLVTPTFLPDNALGPQVVSATTSTKMRGLLRDIVEDGVGKPARVSDLEIGGITGSADLRLPSGAYLETEAINTFAAVFPAEEPEFVLVTMLEGATAVVHGENKDTASWTVVPLSGEILAVLGPMVVAR
jgi:cell division protein FtsI (penicillin-binding protein 3)